jgi:hypothetical protein
VRHLALPPSIWIRLSFESTPRLLIAAMSEAEFDRLCDWIRSDEASHELFARAVELEAERRRQERGE